VASYLYQVHLYHWLERNDFGLIGNAHLVGPIAFKSGASILMFPALAEAFAADTGSHSSEFIVYLTQRHASRLRWLATALCSASGARGWRLRP
jgi:hypothetical protein